MYMLEIQLEMLDDFLLGCFLFSFYIFKQSSHLNICVLLTISLNLFFLLLQLLFPFEKFSYLLKFIVIPNIKLIIFACCSHPLEHIDCETARYFWGINVSDA